MTNAAEQITATRNQIKAAQAQIARFETLLRKEELNLETIRQMDAESISRPELFTQANWMIERRGKSLERFKLDLAELEKRLARLIA